MYFQFTTNEHSARQPVHFLKCSLLCMKTANRRWHCWWKRPFTKLLPLYTSRNAFFWRCTTGETSHLSPWSNTYMYVHIFICMYIDTDNRYSYIQIQFAWTQSFLTPPTQAININHSRRKTYLNQNRIVNRLTESALKLRFHGYNIKHPALVLIHFNTRLSDITTYVCISIQS